MSAEESRTISRTLRNRIKAQMWVGDMEALQRLLATTDLMGSQAQGRLRQSLISDPGDRAPLSEAAIVEKLTHLDLRMKVTMHNFEEVIEGPVRDVMKAVTRPERVKEIEIACGHETYRPYGVPEHDGFVLNLTKYGADVRIFGRTSEWVTYAESILKRELDDSRPWFAHVHDWWFMVVAFNIFPLGLLVLAWIPNLKDDPTTFSGAGYLVSLAVVFVVSMLSPWLLLPRVAPKFQLLKQNQRPSGVVFLSALGSFYGALALSVLPLYLT